MGNFTTAGKNKMLDALAIDYVSLHTDDPGTDGSNEVSGGSPAYAREAISFGSASGGSATQSASVEFDVPAGTTVHYVGYWSSGTFLASDQIAETHYAEQGTFDLDADVLAITDLGA